MSEFPTAPPARPPAVKLTPAFVVALAAGISTGGLIAATARANGVAEATLSRWRRRGRADRKKGLDTAFARLDGAVEAALFARSAWLIGRCDPTALDGLGLDLPWLRTQERKVAERIPPPTLEDQS